MIRINETQVFGFEAALRGMRNPMESWNSSDTVFHKRSWGGAADAAHLVWRMRSIDVPEWPVIGPKDLDLLQRLLASGTEHRKALRNIGIWCDIEPNRGCWQELDTYKVSTVRNSCSTMHKLGHRPLIPEDFQDGVHNPAALAELNELGVKYRETKDYALVIEMKRKLPEGFLQKATYHMNYENAINMFMQRKHHRLPEWAWTGGVKIVDGRQSICDWLYSLPYMNTLLSRALRAEKLRTQGRKSIIADLRSCADSGSSNGANVETIAMLRMLADKYEAEQDLDEGVTT